MYRVKFLLVTVLMLLVGCLPEVASDLSPNSDESLNPDFDGIGLSITTPSTDTKVAGKILIGGYCSHKDYPIKVTNSHDSKVVYSICQADFSWAAVVDAVQAPVGNYNLSAQTFNSDYSESSSVESISLSKGQELCTQENEALLYANFELGGDGDATPYILCNTDQFFNIRFNPDKKFVLGRSIDFSNRVVAPMVVPFKGELDGDGYELSNLIIKDLVGGQVSVGIFKYVQNATFKNLNIRNAYSEGYQRVGIIAGDWRGQGTLQNVKIKGKVDAVTYVGGIAGLGNTDSDMTFDNVKAEIEVSGVDYIGGLFGYAVSTVDSFHVKDSLIMTKVTGDNYVGGMIGRLYDQHLLIENTKRIGDISSQGKHIGGFVGELSSSTITNSENIGRVTSTLDAEDVFLGGFIGETRGFTIVTNSFSHSEIQAGGNYVGGLFGRAYETNLDNVYSRGSINVEDDYYGSTTKYVGGIGGIIGHNSTIENTRSFMNINAKAQYIGGLAGVIDGPNTTVTNSYYKGDITGSVSNVGGLAGVFYGQSVDTSFAQGNIYINDATPDAFIGGLIGHTKKAGSTYTRLYAQVDITANSGTPDYVGGLVGYLIGDNLSESYYVGDISGVRSIVGGLVGFSNGSVSFSYSMANINAGFRYVGGLVGVSLSSSITDSYSLTNISSDGESGGLVGWSEGAASTVERSYYIGSMTKSAGSTLDDSSFGAISGISDNLPGQSDVFYLSTNSVVDDSGSAITPNTTGVGLNSAQLRNIVSYTNYSFNSSSWAEPTTGFKLPALGPDYLYASFPWLSEPNQGFELAQSFSHNPFTRTYASIFIEGDDSLFKINEQILDVVADETPATTVTNGNLEITVLEPLVNGTIVSGKTLISGECGQAGYPIKVTGDLSVSTICQDNNKWASVIDVTPLPVGNISFGVTLHNLDYSQASATIAKSVIKSDALCDQNEADIGTFANSYLGADGEAVPFKICHAGHFANIAYYPDKNYEIINDIDFAGNTIEPIKSIFRGTIEGNGYSLKNYIIKKPTSTNVGLFSIINNASIQNLNIENAKVIGYERVGLLSGSWVGQADIENVNVKGEVEGILYTGGLFGLGNSSFDIDLNNSTFEIDVTGKNYTGGVIGYISTLGGRMRAENNVLKNTVSGRAYVGGFLGTNIDPNMTIIGMNQTGNISGTHHNIGGIAGLVRGGTYLNLSVVGDIGSSYMAKETKLGGLFGEIRLATFNMNDGSYNGNITAGGDHVGGIAGLVQRASLVNVQSHGTLDIEDTKYNSVRYNAGGLVGKISDISSITDSFSTMDITTESKYTGGLVGYWANVNSSLASSFYTGSSLQARTGHVGGLVGYFEGQSILDSYADTAMSIKNTTPNSYIGGLVGQYDNTSADVQKVYSKGSISITSGLSDYVGGLFGAISGGTIDECYAVQDISGVRNRVGGLIGHSSADTSHCYAGGSIVASNKYIGGLVGHQQNGSLKDSFATNNISAGSDAGGAIGLAQTAVSDISHLYANNVVSLTDAGANKVYTGPVVGINVGGTSVDLSTVHYVTENKDLEHNSHGVSINQVDLGTASFFNGFDFVTSKFWRMPTGGFMLPGANVVYNAPITEWLGDGVTVELFNVTGTIAGLNYSQVDLTLNGSETITVNPNETSFNFATQLSSGQSYSVVITGTSDAQIECSIQNGSGIMGTADVSNINLSCPSLMSLGLTPSSLIIGNGLNQQFDLKGLLSTSVEIDLSSAAAWSSSNLVSASVNSTGLMSALSNGVAVIQADIAGFQATSNVSVYDPITAASNLSWTQTSPHSELTVEASWNKSTSGNLASQVIHIYEGASCSENLVSSNSLSGSQETYSFAGINNKVYSYTIDSVSSDSVVNGSVCSSSMQINLPNPNPVTGVNLASGWVSGAQPINSPVVSWTNPSGVSIQNVEIALGTSSGGTDALPFAPIGTNNSYTFTNLSGLTQCQQYYPTLKVVDDGGLESELVSPLAGFVWDNTAPSSTGGLSTSGDATETSSPEVSWSPAPDNCGIYFYEMAIGTTPTTQDVEEFTPVGNVNSYTAISGANGFYLNLSPGVDYYAFIRAVDFAGNRSVHSVSASWQIVEIETTLPNFILWLDASDQNYLTDTAGVNGSDPAFNNSVKTWIDKSGSANQHDFYATTNDASPDYINGELFFNGSNHVYTTPNHDEINLQTLQEKNITFSIRTENNINNRQLIYEEGGAIRGMNIYIDNGNLYCGFWNINDDGDGAQPFVSVSTPIAANRIYHVSWVFDYSNYTGPSGPDGNLKCYVNNTLIGTGSSTTQVFPHSGNIGIGGVLGDTYYHDGSASGSNVDLFRGHILEAMITSESVDDALIETIHNYLIGKWSQLESSSPSPVTFSNNASSTQSALTTWAEIDPTLFTTSSYEVALGTTSGGTELVYWTDIGNVTSYQFINGQDGATFSLVEGTDYYVSVRAVGVFGNYSEVATSNGWEIFNYANHMSDIVLEYDFSNPLGYLDENGVDGSNGAFTGNIKTMVDLSSSATTNNAAGSAVYPTFDAGSNSAVFDGTQSLLTPPNSSEINSGTHAIRNITMMFKTSSEITQRQVIYEEGGGTRGMNIYIEANKLYCGFWNKKDDGDGLQSFVSVSSDIEASKDYVITWEFDYSNYTGPEGDDGALNCFLNAQFVGSASTTSRFFNHNGIKLGGASGTVYHSGSTGSTSSLFNGSIHRLMIHNNSMEVDEIQGLHYHLGF